MATRLPSQLFDHLVGKREQRRRHREAKQPGMFTPAKAEAIARAVLAKLQARELCQLRK